ncbi:MAG TPA: competence/damage-inducible protein A [Chloroflexi bacterium]|nr:competence/damage-inducible protein A [Chloroflexota bacterium]
MAAPVSVEIVAIGNELLLGDVLDTNSHWLCRRLTGLGALVRRVTMVGDDEAVIAAAVRAALERGARLVITTGGLGPTADDVTLRAVAAGLERQLVEHPGAREMVARTYAELQRRGYVDSAALTPARAKMARLPEGAEPPANGVGAAPGALVRLGDGRAVVSLPGVPGELRDIVRGALRPFLAELLGQAVYEEWRVRVASGDESVLAPLLDEVATQSLDVYIKSRAKRFGSDVTFMVSLSARGEDPAGVRSRLDAAWSALRQALSRAGIAAYLEEGPGGDVVEEAP